MDKNNETEDEIGIRLNLTKELDQPLYDYFLKIKRNLGLKTMYSYLKLLQDKNLIKSKKKKSSRPGRPPRIFKSIIKNKKRGINK